MDAPTGRVKRQDADLRDAQRTQDRLRQRLRLARLALWWETIWPLAWPLPALAALFSALALFDLLPMLPGWLHGLTLAAFLALAATAAWRLRRVSPPSAELARRRLERDSGLLHRPLETLSDRLAAGADDPFSRALWQTERDRLTKTLRRLKVRLPSPGLAQHDPWGLRFAPLLLLAVAMAGGWQDAPARFQRAFEPRLGGLGGPPPVLQLWITPPAYTGIAPMLLGTMPPGQLLEIPAGSKILAELQGGSGHAQLMVDDEAQPFQALDADSQRIETTVTKGSRLAVRQGRRRIGAWNMAVIQDRPPSIAFASPPEADADGRLRLDIEAHDDYGVVRAQAVITRVDTPSGVPFLVNLPLGGGHPKDLRQAAWHDLTGHPWAGLPVTIQPQAEDGAGQKGRGDAVTVTLPERKFTNPVARAIIAQRHRLAAEPGARAPVMAGLAEIASTPEAYGNDMVVFLSLATARARLQYDKTVQAVPSVIDMLWETALRIEDGDKPAAERALDEAGRELQDALAANAPEAEIERLMGQLQAAIGQYLDALAQQADRQGLQPMPSGPDDRVVTPEELESMLDRMRELSRTGSRQAAQAMLSQLRQLLDGLRMDGAGQASSEQARRAQQTMNDLQAIARDQRSLLDDTFRRSQQANNPELAPLGNMPAPGDQGGRQGNKAQAGKGRGKGQDNGDRDGAVASQEGLRKRLGQAMQALGNLGVDIPKSLGQGEQAMRDASRALGNGEMEDAVDAQTEALARLQEGNRQTMQAMADKMGGMMRGMSGVGRDPLGRPLPGPGNMDENSVKIPDQADTSKAREVLDELRQRSGQAQRPAAEREYLQRLLKSFF